MPPNQNEPIIYEKAKMTPATKVVMGLLVGFAVLLSVGAILSQSGKNTAAPVAETPEALLEAEIARILAEANNTPFVFTAVPDAKNLISLPPPPADTAIDAAVYEQVRATTSVPETVVQNDVVFNLAPMGISYIDYINNLDDPSEIFQLTDELHHLTLHFNDMYKRPPLAQRIEGVIQMAQLDSILPEVETKSVYPSIRAVDAFLALEIMARIDPDNVQIYETETANLIKRGIGYGLYGQSDVDAAQSLVMQYMDLYTAPTESTASSSDSM